jgi:alpha-N-arabinofuranosidase
MQQKRRQLLTGMGAVLGQSVLGTACSTGSGKALAGAPAASTGATLTVFADDALRPLNPMVLGNNLDWPHSAQGFLKENSTTPAPAYLELADRLAPTALRYPGGTNSDFYHWRNGVGSYDKRKPNKTLEGKEERIGMGTDEYLALCKRWGAEPLITINLATGSAEEAAEWVRYTNRRDNDLPRVRYWEIGNEPYLASHFKEAGMTPAEYAARANAAIRAMKAIDPSIQTGIVLRNDTLGGVESTPFKGYIDTVLKGMQAPFEFACLHSSYFPVTFEKKESEQELFTATMAGVHVMQQDMEATRAKLRQYHPNRKVQLAFTEHNALYSMDILRWGLASIFLSKTDRYIESLAGALFTADCLRVYSQTDDILMANFWSLCGNWWYGAISHEGKPRPQFHVLEAYRDLIRGSLLRTESAGIAPMATARSGFVPAQAAIPSIEAHAVREGKTLRIAILNKHPEKVQTLNIALPGVGKAKASARELGARHYFREDVKWTDRSAEIRDGRIELALGRHSFTVLTIQLG